MWDEIIYLLPNFNDAVVEVWEWICNFIPHFATKEDLLSHVYAGNTSQIYIFQIHDDPPISDWFGQ